ncbi:MAG: hypothetical protein HY689_00820 [Chloroflexi bacterium]|nr:hypothetical protein [Chloroflexota bacterium]
MVFPWLFLILVLLLVAELSVLIPVALRGLVTERRVRLAQPSVRLLLALTLAELLIVLVWGLIILPD